MCRVIYINITSGAIIVAKEFLIKIDSVSLVIYATQRNFLFFGRSMA